MSLHYESPNGSRTSHRMALGEDSVLLRYMLTALHRRWAPLDLSSNGTSCEERRSGACGWQKPCLRGRISTQARSVWRFTLSDKSSTELTSLSCCIVLRGQLLLHHRCGSAGVRSSPVPCKSSGWVSASVAVLAASALQCQWRTVRMSHMRRVVP